MYGWFSLPAGGYGGLHYIIPQAAAGCQAIRHILFRAFRFSPASWWIGIRRSAPFVGRFSDPADPVLVLDWYVEWYHFLSNHGKNKKRHMILFFHPGRFRYLIGGVKTPPYERCVVVFIERKICPPNYKSTRQRRKGNKHIILF